MGIGSDLYVNNVVIHFLVSCGELDCARKVFDESCVRDLVSWNSINGYVKSGKACEALRLYGKMEEDGVKPDEVTMIGVISACAQLEDLNLEDEQIEFEDVSINVPKDAYDSLPSYMKALASWEVILVVTREDGVKRWQQRVILNLVAMNRGTTDLRGVHKFWMVEAGGGWWRQGVHKFWM
ncbi:Pentatricopeptide repeat-containing protein [Artemisia annua]|uniref:Pentatricopeptide repeat-containing protein n=1 Tax=Artemisia annua TaxID=35608 RepID=A0A2U1NBA7_ARTAN|nr:Pentatricopeptide repeat-containing protein [Artemisia annua]